MERFLQVLFLLHSVGLATSTSGTTQRLREIFIGKCLEYQNVINTTPFQRGQKNCTDLWMKFERAFRYRDPCDVLPDRYEDFVTAAVHPVPRDKSLFWEQVEATVKEYSYFGKRFTTIADTLTGYIGNNLMWCGQPNEPGINYRTCPDWASCNASDYSFWKAASRKFAGEAHGTVYMLLNGSANVAFPSESILATYELPNLTSDNVTQLHAFVLHDLGKPRVETCGMGSLKELAARAKKKNLGFKCTDDPKALHFLLCVDNPHNPSCKLVGKTPLQTCSGSTVHTLYLTVSIYVIVVSTLIAIL